MKKLAANVATASLLASTIALAACSIDPVKKESELVYSDVVVAATPEKVMRSLQDRQRRCGSLLGALTASGSYMPNEVDQVLDVQAFIPHAGQVGMARIRMSSTAAGTLVRVGVPPKDVGGSPQRKISALAADPSLPCDY